VVAGLGKVQHRNMHRLLRRQGVPEAVDVDFATVFEHRDYVHPQRKEWKVPNASGHLVLLNVL